MVPHGQFEEALHEAAGAETTAFAVTTIRDEVKGESLAVVYTCDKDRIAEALTAANLT